MSVIEEFIDTLGDLGYGHEPQPDWSETIDGFVKLAEEIDIPQVFEAQVATTFAVLIPVIETLQAQINSLEERVADLIADLQGGLTVG